MAQLPGGEGRTLAMRNVANAWARQDSAATLAWAQELPAGADRDGAATEIVNVLARADRDRALAAVELVTDESIRNSALVAIIRGNAYIAPDFVAPLMGRVRMEENERERIQEKIDAARNVVRE